MADVSHILQLDQKRKSVAVHRDIPIDLDICLLAAFDPNPIIQAEYNSDREEYLKQSARDSIQVLVNSLFASPTSLTDDGVVANLPTHLGVKTNLPRAKRLPKPKPLTKWQKFANEKGIAPKPQRDKVIFDEQKGEWVNRWGWKGKNKEEEGAWIREVKPSDELDPNRGLESNPAKQARKQRKLKNDQQRLKNIQRANTEILKSSSNHSHTLPTTLSTPSLPPSSDKKAAIRAAKIAHHTVESKAQAQAKRLQQAQRKQEVEQLLLSTKKSTASLGKFDRQLVNEPKLKGVKRKFDPTEQSARLERKNQLEIVAQLVKNPTAFKEKSIKKQKKGSTSEPQGDHQDSGLINTRKAIRHLTGGRGPTALEKSSTNKKPSKQSKKRT